ncbi:MAG: hypothetical protein EP343_34055 [Deltaproteobacteria bacterium]|nr:MAG: hypothetical protein EP343_34055 [Deltaproteobacteria bacterium]
MLPRNHRWLLLAVVFALVGCTSPSPPDTTVEPQAIEGTQVSMSFARKGFFDAPFPSEDLRGDNNHIHLSGFPNPNNVGFVQSLVDIIQNDSRGFGVSSAIFLKMSGPLDATLLPKWKATIEPSSPVFLVSVDKGQPDYLQKYPIKPKFEDDGGKFGTLNQLTLLPLQGVPLRPQTLYAAVVLRSLKDKDGKELGISLPMAQLAANVRPSDLSEAAYAQYKVALEALDEAGVKRTDIAGLTVFRTDDPTQGLRRAVEQTQTSVSLKWEKDWTQTEDFPDFCVFENTVKMPVFQTGKPPFQDDQGGVWKWEGQGASASLVQQGTEVSRVLVTVPKTKMPEGGFPVVNFVRTGGGGDRPLVERGFRSTKGGPAQDKGSGPARNFAKAGYAGISADGPHGGLRNITKGDEQFLIFNITNPGAMRDNIRQSALELAWLPKLLPSISIDVKGCSGVTAPNDTVKFSTESMVLMGHSMGATISPLVLANAPAYRASILSGAGGSWIENIVYKKSPVATRPLAEAILLYTGTPRTLHTHDPVLSLLQWGGEAADPPVYARTIVNEPSESKPRHVLMLQGIVDTYILPSIANSLSLALGLDLAGESLDAKDSSLDIFQPLKDILPSLGRKVLSFPVSGNRKVKDSSVTAVVVQHKQGSIEDGHEVVFQTEGPKHQYRCFLESLRAGKVPQVPKAGKEWDTCP